MAAVAHGWCWTLLASATVDNQCCVTRACLARCWLMRHRGLHSPCGPKHLSALRSCGFGLTINNHRPCWSTAVEKLFTQRTLWFACWLPHRQPLRLPLTWFNPFVGVSPKPIHLPAVATALRWSYHHSPNGCDATHFRNGLGGLRRPP